MYELIGKLSEEGALVGKLAQLVPGVETEEISITENGITTAPYGKAYNKVTVAVPTSTLIDKTVTENGTYNASSDNADGYSSVSVSVPSVDPYEKFNEMIEQKLYYFKTKASGRVPIFGLNNNAGDFIPLTFFSMRNSKYWLYANHFRTDALTYALFGEINCYGNNIFLACPGIRTVVNRQKSVGILSSSGFTGSEIAKGRGYIYVPDLDSNGNNLVDQYKVATNWSVYANQIKGYSEAPAYDATVTYSIGDVCKYNGKFYGYCKEDLTSSTGNAPTGTTEDNAYWEYVDDIEV